MAARQARKEPIEERIDVLEKKIDEVLRYLDILLGSTEDMTTLMSAQDIAAMFDVPAGSIYTYNRYLLPKCGVTIQQHSKTRWTKKEVLEWNSIPVEERKRIRDAI